MVPEEVKVKPESLTTIGTDDILPGELGTVAMWATVFALGCKHVAQTTRSLYTHVMQLDVGRMNIPDSGYSNSATRATSPGRLEDDVVTPDPLRSCRRK